MKARFQTLKKSLALAPLEDRVTRNLLMHFVDGQGTLIEIYQNALSEGKVMLYNKHSLEFEFALVNPKKFQEKGFNLVAEKRGILAFSLPYAIGADGIYVLQTCLIFALDDSDALSQFLDYQLVRERVTCLTTNPICSSFMSAHEMAWVAEFALAARERKLDSYVKWLLGFPGNERLKILLKSSFSKETFSHAYGHGCVYKPFEILREKSNSLSEAQTIEDLVKNFVCPPAIIEELLAANKNG